MTTTIKVKGSIAPADRITPVLLMGYEMNRAGGSNILNVPGRAKPVVVFHPTYARKGTLQVLLADEAAATAFDALMARQTVFTLTDTDRAIAGMDFVVDDGGYKVQLEDETRELFIGTVQIVEA